MNVTYIPAIITASVALITAIGAQFLNNWLTYKRENKKYLKEVYEKFISEYFIDVLRYPRVITRIISENEIKKELNLSEVIDAMFQKVHYGDKHLQSLNLEYKTIKYSEEPLEGIEEVLQFKICYYFLQYSNEIFKKIGFKLEYNVEVQLIQTIKEYAFLYICSTLQSYEEAKNKLIGMNRLHWNLLEEHSLKDFKRKMPEQILEEIDKEWDKRFKDLKDTQ